MTAFTLGWTHSVEHVRWEEDWRVTPAGLVLVEARVEGLGRRHGARRRRPARRRLVDLGARTAPPQPELVLAASGATGGGWTLCAAGACRELGATPGAPIRLTACG